MKYNPRQDRALRRTIRRSHNPRKSRKQQMKKIGVEQKVKKIANSFGNYGAVVELKDRPLVGDARKEPGVYRSVFTGEAKTARELIDKYYKPSHYPTRDTLTEQLGDSSKHSKLPTLLLGLVILYLIFFR